MPRNSDAPRTAKSAPKTTKTTKVTRPRSAKGQTKTVAVVAVSSPADELDPRWELFVEQYFICELNGTMAAKAAGYSGDTNSLAVQASRLLRNAKVRARINARLDEFHLGADEVLARMSFHARGSMADFVDADSGVIDLKKARDAYRMGLIKRYRTKTIINSKEDTETVETEIELYDAQASLRDLGKHLGLFTDKIELSLPQEARKALASLFNLITDSGIDPADFIEAAVEEIKASKAIAANTSVERID